MAKSVVLSVVENKNVFLKKNNLNLSFHYTTIFFKSTKSTVLLINSKNNSKFLRKIKKKAKYEKLSVSEHKNLKPNSIN